MSGTKAAERSCRILETIGGYDRCDYGVSYKLEKVQEMSA